MSIFDLIAEDVQRLSDDMLAELLGRLIEAEVANNGLPLSAITHGGHNNAPDQGVDARVCWSGGPERTDFLPRRCTAFQSKAETMSRKPLTDEMAPGGQPRPVFRELAEQDGAYVMFCGKDDCTDGMLRDRKSAMRSAVSTVSQIDRTQLDFYDASRIARWVNMHTGVAAWLRDRLERPLWGWRSYGPWSRLRSTEDLPYLSDETPRAAFTFDDEAPQVSILDAMNRVRSELALPGRSVRLVGLSGTGKTRFAEALFDETLGDSALPKPRAIYGDVASAEVSPTRVAEQLLFDKRRAVMVADNCPATAHRQVTQIIIQSDSQLSLLSIDYDVGEDQPEATLVVVFGKDSDDIIAALLAQRAPSLQPSDRDRITEFSGGNSRIALALVRSVQEGGSLADLTDRELVRRLFQDDRHPSNDTLLRCAEVASLVIQHSVEPGEEETDPEHHHLARLADVSPGKMFRATSIFLDRGVAQQRGRWRAILPHALAARLARQALGRLPRGHLYEAFAVRASRRLALSFAKRLGQVDDHTQAQALARMLLAEDGPIKAISEDDEWGLDMLQALAPAAQDTALDLIERSLEMDVDGALVRHKSDTRYLIAKLLLHLAYRPALFNRAASIVAQVVKDEDRNNNTNSVRRLFEQLFWVVRSGTLAEPLQRIGLIEGMLAGVDQSFRRLAVDAFGAMLRVTNFSSNIDVTKFGGQARSWGWFAKDKEQMERHFADAAKRLTDLAISQDPLAEQAKQVLAGSISGLTDERLIHIAECVVDALAKGGFWAAGWQAICTRLNFGRSKSCHELIERVERLERLLAPRSLDDRFEAFVLYSGWQLYTPYPRCENDHRIDIRPKIERISVELRDEPRRLAAFAELATRRGQGEAAVVFGESLVLAGFEGSHLYSIGVGAWDAASPKERHIGFLYGVLRGIAAQDVGKAEEMLDQIDHHNTLAAELVGLSRAVRPMSAASLNRIHRSLRAGRVNPASLVRLAGAASEDQVAQRELAILLRDLAERGQDGHSAAARIMFFLQEGPAVAADRLSPDLCALARRLVESEYLFSSNDAALHIKIVLAKSVLKRENDAKLALKIIGDIRLVVEAGGWGEESLKDVLIFIAEQFPEVFLTEVVLHRRPEDLRWDFFISNDDSDMRTSQHPIDSVDCSLLLEWVRADPGGRSRLVAKIIAYAENGDGPEGDMVWTSKALELIGIEETTRDVLQEFESRFYLGGWSGSEASRYVRRRALCEAFLYHPNPVMGSWARDALHGIERAIQRAEQSERRQNQSFE